MNNLPTVNSREKYQFIHHFVPHPVHKTRATLLTHKALFSYAFLMIFALGIFRIVPTIAPGVLGYASNINTADLLSDTNKIRKEHGLNELKLNNSLSVAAQKKAEHMLAEDYWAHVSPSGVKPWDFILAQGYDYSYAGENLAKNFDRSGDVVNAWYESPTHRDNLLGDKYTEIGFAVVNGVLDGYETTLVVQMFGTSRSPSYTASTQPENSTPTTPVASKNLAEQKGISDTNESETPSPVESPPAPIARVASTESSVLPYRTSTPSYLVSMKTVTQLMFISFIGFVFILLTLDIWYSEKKAIPKFTGHTFAHLTFLLFIMFSVWFVLSPGRVL